MTINEGLEVLALMKDRIAELKVLREQNSTRDSWRTGKDVLEVKETVYDIKKIDKLVSRLSKDLRLLTSAIKKTNATADIQGYKDMPATDVDLGELEDFEKDA